MGETKAGAAAAAANATPRHFQSLRFQSPLPLWCILQSSLQPNPKNSHAMRSMPPQPRFPVPPHQGSLPIHHSLFAQLARTSLVSIVIAFAWSDLVTSFPSPPKRKGYGCLSGRPHPGESAKGKLPPTHKPNPNLYPLVISHSPRHATGRRPFDYPHFLSCLPLHPGLPISLERS